jgi:hypothetical protein
MQEVRKLRLERDKVNKSYKTPSFFDKVRENIPKPKINQNTIYGNSNTAKNIFGSSGGNARKKIFGK